jgi:cobalt-zinc-cadmium efflux system outer membrane protein
MQTKQGCWVIAGLVLLAGCQTANTRRTAAHKPPVVVPSNTAMSATLSEPTQVMPTKRDSKQEVFQAAASGESTSDVRTANMSAATGTEATPSTANSAAVWKLTLDDAINTALARNPDLVTLRENEGISDAALGVAQTYPWNPFVQTQYFPTAFNKDGSRGPGSGYVWLMQTVELAHQQRHREEAAEANLNTVRWNIKQAELLNIAQTERLYFTALFQRDVHELTKSAADLNDELLATMERLFQAGQVPVANVTMARVTARSSRRQADLAEANYQTALLALRQQLVLPPDTPFELDGDLAKWEWHPAANVTALPENPLQMTIPMDVAAQLVANRPDVQAARSDVQTARSNADLANANRVQNVAVGPIYDRDDFGTQFIGFRTQFNVPVFDNGQPLTRQRCAEYRQRAVACQQLEMRAALEAQLAIDRYERARRIVEHSQRDNSKTWAEEIRAIDEQFKAGQADILAVFATRTSLIQDHRAYLDALNELAQAAANVTAATGMPSNALFSASPQ